MFRSRIVALTFLTALPVYAGMAAAPHFAAAQSLRPPGDLRDGGRDLYQPVQGVDAAGLTLRIDRLENQVRNLTGQLEQMQFANRRLEEQLKKFQQDVEFRFQENNGRGAPGARPATPPASPPGRRTDSGAPTASPVAAVTGEATPLSSTPPTRLSANSRPPRGDAFDPEANPNAPGAPRQLGALPGAPGGTAPRPPRTPLTGGPLDDEDEADINAPIDLMRRAPVAGAPTGLGVPAPAPVQIAPPPGAGAVAALPPTAPLLPPTPKEEFDRAVASLRGGQFEAAETGFRSFLQKFPKNALVADATFQLGETYFRRQRPREAAEQYLKVTTDFGQSRRAPEALVKLGLSLEKLGAKEQACAAYGEVGRKYPAANASVRASAEKEQKRAQC